MAAAFVAEVSIIFDASVDFTNSTLQSVVFQAVYAGSPLIPEASFGNFLTVSLRSQVKSTLTTRAPKVVKGLAVVNPALGSIQFERGETFLASMIKGFYFASQQ